MKNPKTYILIWMSMTHNLDGSSRKYSPMWRSFITHLTPEQIRDEHEASYGVGCVKDIIDVTNPNKVDSVMPK